MKRKISIAVFFALCAAARADDACIPTAADYLGPYYIADMPVMKNINRFAKPGEPLTVSGQIRAADASRSPVADARIEVWQTDGDGDYHPHDNGKRGDYDDAELDLRATVVADGEGRFAFATVIPGAEGFFARAKHFHYRVSAAGFQTLVTQHYLRENGGMPGGKCRSAAIKRDENGATFAAPTIYLQAE